MAFVICCVDFTARTRRRMSISDGIYALALRIDAYDSLNSFNAALSSFLI